MRTHGIAKLEEDSMEHENVPGHTLASYAQQVSFPNWNIMVGDLGQKFARRSSFEREIPQATVDVEDMTEFLPKTGRQFEKNISSPREQTTNTENYSPHLANRDEIANDESRKSILRDTTYSNHDVSPRRTPIVRYCGMIKEDSQESDEQSPVEREESAPSKIHISTVSIMLKSSKGKKRQESYANSLKIQPKGNSVREDDDNDNDDDDEAIEKLSQRGTYSQIERSYKELEINGENTNDTAANKQETKDEHTNTGATTNIKGTQNHEKERLDKTGKSSQSEKRSDALSSINRTSKLRSHRSGAMDDGYLTPDYVNVENRSSVTDLENRFRKKSSSFSGALPLSFQADKEGSRTSSSDCMNESKVSQRRRGTVDMGRVQPPRSPLLPKENHHHHTHNQQRKLDPSHYLMQGGKRRGSFNPTYNQYNTTMHKNRKNNTARARSLFICNTDERFALRDRLMRHASPELRESLESEDETLKKDHGTAVQIAVNGDSNVTDVERRPLRKSISFDSRPPIKENAQEIAEFYEKLKNSENLIGPHRSGNRKTGIVPSPTMRSKDSPSTIIETRETETKTFTSNGGLFGDSRFSKPRGRQTRAHSNFAGVPSMYLGLLRDKSTDHAPITRSQSDSISSASSSEGGESVDPFPMHTAVKNGRQKRLRKLVSKGMDVNTRDADGWPPIHYALSAGNFEIVAFLLKAGANITDYTKGRTSKYFK